MGMVRNQQITRREEFEPRRLGGVRVSLQRTHVELVCVPSHTLIWECACFREYDGAGIQRPVGFVVEILELERRVCLTLVSLRVIKWNERTALFQHGVEFASIHEMDGKHTFRFQPAIHVFKQSVNVLHIVDSIEEAGYVAECAGFVDVGVHKVALRVYVGGIPISGFL